VVGYASVAEPLTILLRKDAVFEWSGEQENAFRSLREAFVGDAVQMMYRRDAEVIELHTDASAIGLGAVLLQYRKRNKPLKMVYCASRRTSEHYNNN